MTTPDPSTDGAVVRSFCRVCIASCGILVDVQGGEVTRIRGDSDHPLSHGYTCEKGRAQLGRSRSAGRLLSARLGRGESSRTVTSVELLDDLAAEVVEVARSSGSDAVATYAGGGASLDASGWIAFSRLTRGLNTRSRYTPMTIDCPSKPLVAELMSGNPSLIPQIDPGARLTLVIGSNPVISHGHTASFPDPVRRLKSLARAGSLVVVDPRRTETARLATVHLAIRPGTDFVLLAFLVRAMLVDGADEEYLSRFTDGRDALARAVGRYDERTASDVCGVSPTQLDELVESLRSVKRLAVITGTGSTMSEHANLNEWLAWCLALVMGSFDRRGGMWFNPGFLARHDSRRATPPPGPGAGPASRPELASRWHEFPSGALVDEIEAGHVRALLVAGGNPAVALPDTKRVLSALESLDVLAVADVVDTATSRLATHVLPVATALERADLTYKTEQLLPAVSAQYTSAVLARPGDVMPLSWWCVELARRLGFELPGSRRSDEPNNEAEPGAVRPFDQSEDAFLATLCDEPTFERLRRSHGLVLDDRETYGWVLDRGLPFGAWRLAPETLVAELGAVSLSGLIDSRLVLTPRRQRGHHNSSHSPGGAKSSALMSGLDAGQLGIGDGSRVRIASSHGSLEARVEVDLEGRPGFLSLPHGFEELNVNHLTSADVLSPLTGMPRFSGIAVDITPLDTDSIEPGENGGGEELQTAPSELGIDPAQ